LGFAGVAFSMAIVAQPDPSDIVTVSAEGSAVLASEANLQNALKAI